MKQVQEQDHIMRDLSRPRTVMEYIRLYLTGFSMGAADIVPGVSGGTMAFILGVYETLIDAIKSVNFEAIRLALRFRFGALFNHIPVRFLIPLGLGILSAVFLLSGLLDEWLTTQPTLVFAFFGGLIVASIISVGWKVKWSAGPVLALIGGTVVAFWVVGLPILDDAGHEPLTLFFSGMIAICAMILPGISGSFILLILGQYQHVLGAVRSLDIVTLASVALGAVVGIIGFSRILSWLLKHYEHVTIAALVGFMLGSLRLIIHRMMVIQDPITEVEQAAQLDSTTILLAAGLFLIGFLLVSLLDHLQSRSNPVFSLFGRRSVAAAVTE